MPAALCENRTKSALDRALRQLLEQKPLDQIRVREVTELCAIRRQSFYYHFPDVYALFEWSLQQERESLLVRQENYFTWQQALADLLDHTAQYRSYYQALLKSRGRAGFRNMLGPVLENLLKNTLDYYQRRCGTSRDAAMEQTQLDCWETLLLALLESWVQNELQQQPDQILTLMESTIHQGAVGAAWQNLPLQTC